VTLSYTFFDTEAKAVTSDLRKSAQEAPPHG